MKQRVKLAQALVGDPRLLLLDEPTNGLDPAGRNAMLELIERIGAEFGIPIVVASHLLGEIERICDGLVAIEAGRLLRADTMDSFTRASQTLLIEVEEGTDALLEELARRGLHARPYQRALLVPIAGDDTYDAVRDSVAALGLPLSRLEQRRHQVEEIFRDDDQPRSARHSWRPQMPTESIARRQARAARPPRAGSSTTSATSATTARGSAGQRIVAALAWHSFRSAFGFGRGAKAKIVPVIAMIAICLPAVVNAFAMSRGNPRVVDYDTYTPVLRDLIMTVFVAVQAPELVSRDLRSRVLPLYFSRPIKPGDYPLAKYLGFTAACLVMLEVPLLLLYGGSVANVHGGAAVWAQTRALIPGLLLGAHVGRVAGRDQPVPRVAERPPRPGDRGGGDRAPAHLHPRRDPAPGRDPVRHRRRARQGPRRRRRRVSPRRRRWPACSARSPCSTACAGGSAAPTPATTCPSPAPSARSTPSS